MAQWGVALSRWGNPFGVGVRSALQVQAGLTAVERARAIGAKTDRERAYIDAVATLYVDAGRLSQQARVEGYRDAMGRLAQRYSADTEAAIFFALSLINRSRIPRGGISNDRWRSHTARLFRAYWDGLGI